jgi:dimethylargininase
MLVAITRAVSRSINECELTHLERTPIDLERARQQHRAYEHALRSMGVQVQSLTEEPDLPDSVFVEDIAIVLAECALLTRPGALSRQAETSSIAAALAPHRELYQIMAPGTLDGGDVLVVGQMIYAGLSSRTNQAAIDQLRSFTSPHGYQVKEVHLSGGLHLKSSVTQVAAETLLVNPAWVEKSNFPAYKIIEIHPSEQYAANALLVGGNVLYQPAFPRTGERLEAVGIHPLLVDASELGKAEGALTCCSLIFSSIAAPSV